MKPMKRRTTKIADKQKFRIALFGGGSKRTLIPQYLAEPNTKAIVLDNRNELASQLDYFNANDIAYFDLGPNESSYNLGQYASPEAQEQIRSVANFSTDYGNGARPLIGSLSTCSRMEQPDFKQFLQDLSEEVLQKTNGILEHLDIVCLGSFAGATGVPALIAASNAVASEFTRMNLTVHVEFDLVGPTTFLGASPRAAKIAAASLTALLATVTDSNPDNTRITRTLALSELPPLGQDQDSRDTLLRLATQARNATELVTPREIDRPNEAATSSSGNVYSYETDVIGSIPQSVISSQVAASLHTQLLSKSANLGNQPGLVEELYVDQVTTNCPRPTVQAILASANGLELDDLVKKLSMKGSVHRLSLKARLSNEVTHDLRGLGLQMRSIPNSLQEAIEALNLLYSLQAILASENELCQVQAAYFDALVDQTTEELKTSFKKFSRAGKSRREKVAARLEADMDDIRNVFDQLQFQQQLAEELNNAISEIHQLIDLHSSWLTGVQDLLSEHMPTAMDFDERNLIETYPIEDIYPQLVTLRNLDRKSIVESLAGFAKSVSIHGLALIAGSYEASHDQIAERLINPELEVLGPPLGGKARRDAGDTVLVLPKCSNALQDLLTERINSKSPSTGLAFTDSIQFGVGAVRFKTRQYDRLKDIFDGHLLKALQEALDDPVWQLNFINGFNDIEKLGLKVIDGKVSFPD